MRNSGLYRGYNGSEKVFLAEISLMGRFIEHPETLFYSRWHDSRFSSNPSGTGQNQLVDPTSSRRFAVPHELQCGLGYLLLLAARDVALTDRIGGLAAWIRFVMRPSKWRVIMNKLFTGRSNTVSLAPQVAAAEKVAIGEAAACD